MTRRIADLDVPTPDLEQQVRDAAADWPATRRAIRDRQEQIRQATNPNPPNTTPEEGR
jgi:hypothetical protein